MSPISLGNPRDSQEQALASLLQVPDLAVELGERFAAGGFGLYLVGGSVRDALLGRPGGDLDFTTDAHPQDVLRLVHGWAEGVWETGIAFGTVGLLRAGTTVEVTTFRSEDYDPASRNPAVSYGQRLEEDLSRRDFTVNSMAVSLPDRLFVDPFQGLRDLAAGLLRTPGPAERSFTDDPLRILRAARFVAQLGFTPLPEVVAAMGALADRLSIVSPERVRDELSKLLLSADPVVGLELLVDTGVAEVVLPELPQLALAPDEHHHHKDVYAHTLTVLRQAIEREGPGSPDLVLRLAALLHDIGKPDTRRFLPDGRVSFHHHEVRGAELARRRLQALRFPKDVVASVERLVALHLRFHGYGTGEWTDSAVRRYVADAGGELARLHALVRSDCTTRNRAKARRLALAYDDLVARIEDLARREDLEAIRPDLDGNEIMQVLGLPPGPVIGRARQHLLDVRMERGPRDHDAAIAELLRWAAEQGLGGAAGGAAD
ncbi:MAG: CCA tRNA nucleotidyltransferase [Mycobacteriales bacterium]